MLRFLTAGESHGPAEVAILEGMPAGLEITHEDIQKELDKRAGGAGRGGRGKIEKDKVKILSGIRHGKTIGSPIALIVENLDFKNWKGIMDVEPPPVGAQNLVPEQPVTTPRPGHADLAGSIKYGADDVRNILERASARETVMRVAVGTICKKFLAEFNIEVAAHTIQIGPEKLPKHTLQGLTFQGIKNVHKSNPDIRCIDPETSKRMKEAIRQATIEKNTLGGVIEVIAHNVPVGLGSHVHPDRKLDGLLAQSLMSIPSVKAIEIGEGIENAGKLGSDVHDEIFPTFKGQTFQGYIRKKNRAGGIEGGISNGEDIVCRVYHKPISTLGNPLNTVDIRTRKPTKALVERSDVCVVPRACVIAESMVSYIIVQMFLEKFGGDSINEIRQHFLGKEWQNKN